MYRYLTNVQSACEFVIRWFGVFLAVLVLHNNGLEPVAVIWAAIIMVALVIWVLTQLVLWVIQWRSERVR